MPGEVITSERIRLPASEVLLGALMITGHRTGASTNELLAYEDAISDPDFFMEDPEDWQSRAICPQTDPNAFFPEKGGSTREAKRICLACPVRSDCLEYAINNDERFGIWGGLSERERRKLKKRAT